MTSPRPIRVLPSRVLLALALLGSAPAVAQDAEAPRAEAPGVEAPAGAPEAKPKPRKPAPPKAAASKAQAAKPAAAAGAPWPSGATSVSETYGDWTVSCVRESEKSACILMQSQGDNRTGRRQFAIEIKTPVDGRADGIILMPLGLDIEPGVTFKIDDQTLGKGAPYLACGKDGCMVPISLPTLATDTMAKSQTMTVSAMKPEAKEPTLVKVPLAGFGPALARALALAS